MSDYTEISIICSDEISDILIAELYNLGYEGFWEIENGFKAYIDKDIFNPQDLTDIIEKHKLLGNPVNYSILTIPYKNWNEEWEKNFEPIVIANKFLIKAPFHSVDSSNLVSFTISPKMAFGTGHHSTTQLMAEIMQHIDFNKKTVLDIGTGTGILAILAEYFGADNIVAVDNAPEAIDCVQENISINNCSKIQTYISEIDQIKEVSFDIVLANINRNTLSDHAEIISEKLIKGGILLLSGFYQNDINYISPIFENVKLRFKSSICKNTWVACQYFKE